MRGDQILGLVGAKEVKLGRKHLKTNLKGVRGKVLRAAARGQYLAGKVLRGALRSIRPTDGTLPIIPACALLLASAG